MLHADLQALFASNQKKFWLLNGKRNTARKIVRRCIACFKINPKLSNQMMGSLPLDRITCQRVFSVVGIDYWPHY